VQAGDLLVSITADVGMVAVVPDHLGEAYINQHIALARPKSEVCSPYVAWFLASERGQTQLKAMQRGATKLGLGLEDIRSVEVPIAPLPEQHRIVAEIEKHFTRLDAAVAALQRARANLKRYRAAVLKAAVEGRLVPIEAEVHGRVQAQEGPAILGRVAEARSEYVATPIGKLRVINNGDPAAGPVEDPYPLPDGWAWSPVGRFAEIQGGIQKQPKRTPRNNAYPFLRVANVLRGRLNLEEVHQIELFGDELSRLRLQPGDLLVVEGNGSPSEIGRMAVWNGAIDNCVHQNHIIRVRPLEGIVPEYVQAYWNSPDGSRQVMNVASSTSGLYTLSVSKVSRLQVPLPPTAEQRRIVTEVERRISVIEAMDSAVEHGLKRAERLRQAILKRAFEGRLVPQNPTDEPASVLLERIQSERAAFPAARRGGGLRGRKDRAVQGTLAL
jgi:type I restriction enzyme S subunit